MQFSYLSSCDILCIHTTLHPGGEVDGALLTVLSLNSTTLNSSNQKYNAGKTKCGMHLKVQCGKGRLISVKAIQGLQSEVFSYVSLTLALRYL